MTNLEEASSAKRVETEKSVIPGTAIEGEIARPPLPRSLVKGGAKYLGDVVAGLGSVVAKEVTDTLALIHDILHFDDDEPNSMLVRAPDGHIVVVPTESLAAARKAKFVPLKTFEEIGASFTGTIPQLLDIFHERIVSGPAPWLPAHVLEHLQDFGAEELFQRKFGRSLQSALKGLDE